MLYGYRFLGDYHFQPAYAAGHVVLASVSELLMAQCFYNPEIVQIVKALAGGGMYESDSNDDKEGAYHVCKQGKAVQPPGGIQNKTTSGARLRAASSGATLRSTVSFCYKCILVDTVSCVFFSYLQGL